MTPDTEADIFGDPLARAPGGRAAKAKADPRRCARCGGVFDAGRATTEEPVVPLIWDKDYSDFCTSCWWKMVGERSAGGAPCP
jgi:hypothetical protein